MNHETCIICNSSILKSRFPVGNSLIKECVNCSLQFLSPIPDKMTLDIIYQDYYSSWGIDKATEEVSIMKQNSFRDYFEKLDLSTSTGKLLDVGCATGEMLTVAKSMGFDVHGVEISPDGIKKCSEIFGKDKILGKPLEHTDFPNDYFDIITLSDVIEHITNPNLFFTVLTDILKPDGLLLIITPDTASWSRKIMGKYWLHYKPEHIYYYNRRNLTKLLSDNYTLIVADKAYKTLNINYISQVLSGYSKNHVKQIIGILVKMIPARLASLNFKIHAAEMLMLFRKKC